MVRFGADQILSGTKGTYTDEDIDALIARGEEKTSAMQAKLQTDAQHNLADFTLLAEDETGVDTFDFEGKNYRDKEKLTGNFINLPQRARKRNYDLNAMAGGGGVGQSHALKAHAADAAAKKRKKGGAFNHDFQLFDRERMNAIFKKEESLGDQKLDLMKTISDIRSKANVAPPLGSGVGTGQSREELLKSAEDLEKQLDLLKLSPEEEEEKARLTAEGFPDWSRKDFKTFCASLERYGRYDFSSISQAVMSECGKDLKEVQRYFVAFWTNYRRIGDWQKILDRVERGEKKILRLRQIRDAIQEKVERHLELTFDSHYGADAEGDGPTKKIPSVADLLHYSWPKMKVNYGSNTRGRAYQEEEDAFLICMMYRHGYGAAERIRMEIRRAWQFRFDWYFKSRSALEIQKRCDLLVKVVERENEEVRKKEDEEDRRATAAISAQGESTPQDATTKALPIAATETA